MTHPESASAAARPETAAALAALDRLADVLARENAALRSRDAQALAALAEDKRAAVDACETLIERSTAAGGAGSPERPSEALARAKARLAKLMDENQQRLRVAMTANQRLIKAIAAAAQAKNPDAGAYASDGRKGGVGGRTINPPALSFNRAL